MTADLSRRRTAAVRRPGPALRPRLEGLEDRTVPSTFTVNTALDDATPGNGKQSIREAITRANSTPGADTIVLPAGVFKIAITGSEVNPNETGDFDITDALTIRGAGSGLSVVDGQQLDRVFDIAGTAPSSIQVVLQGLTVRNGKVDGDGGGIRVGNANLVVRDCAVCGNRASLTGGGISNGPVGGTGIVRLVRTTVARNAAGGFGGGLCFIGASTLIVQDSTVRRNANVAGGGGILASTASLTNCTVSGNTSGNSSGGGIDAGTANLTNCTVSGNTAGSSGGGISAGTANLTNCTVSGNVVSTSVSDGTGQGGGISANNATLTSCTVSGNIASIEGGGIRSTSATLIGSTLSGNRRGTVGRRIVWWT